MAISFISIQSQNEVINSNKENAKSKGSTLEKIASGKKYNHPRDGISEYRNISTLKTSINSYNNLFKTLSQYSSRMEIALETTSLLREQYEKLKDAIVKMDTTLTVNGNLSDPDYVRGKNKRSEIQEEIIPMLNIISSIVNNTDFLGEKTFQKTDRSTGEPILTKEFKFYMSPHDDFSVTMANIDLASSITAYSGDFDSDTGRYNGSITDLSNIFKSDILYENFSSGESFLIGDDDIKKIQDEIDYVRDYINDTANATKTTEEVKTEAKNKLTSLVIGDTNLNTALTNAIDDVSNTAVKGDVLKKISDFLRLNSLTRTNVLGALNNTIENVNQNYQYVMSALTNIDNSEKLLTIQKNNIQFALSSIEDIDVQEEMMNLMNEEVLEQLSAESLIKIKESSKYIVRLIQS